MILDDCELLDLVVVAKKRPPDDESLGAYSQFFRITSPVLRAFLMTRLSPDMHADIDDLAQTSYLSFFETGMYSYNSKKGSVASYFFSIARNLANDYYKKQRRKKETSFPGDLESPVTDNEILKAELLSGLSDAIHNLDDRKQLLIQMRIYESLPYEHIAKRLSKLEGKVVLASTLRGRMKEIISTLRKTLKRGGYGQ